MGFQPWRGCSWSSRFCCCDIGELCLSSRLSVTTLGVCQEFISLVTQKDGLESWSGGNYFLERTHNQHRGLHLESVAGEIAENVSEDYSD